MVGLSLIKSWIPSSAKYYIKQMANYIYNIRMMQYYRRVKPYNKGRYPMGINLIGDIKAETGLGQSMRILAKLLSESDIPYTIIQIDQSSDLKHDNNEWNAMITDKAQYAVNLIHINASDWARKYTMIDNDILDERYNIAYWLWELEEFPKEWRKCIQTVDEIWAPSEFICNSLRHCTEKMICKIPYAIDIQMPVQYTRDYFGIPDYVFLNMIMYDFISVSERKNPEGMIQAFRTAFDVSYANENRIGLVVKVNHLKKKEDLEKLKEQLQGYRYVYYITENLTRREVEALVAAADVLLSLHRSEGFGLPAAEAMYLGTVVVATNWSATTEFMSADTACLVDYSMIKLDRFCGPYRKGSRWADADITQAAQYLKRLFEDREYYEKLREKAMCRIREELSVKRMADNIACRIDKI